MAGDLICHTSPHPSTLSPPQSPPLAHTTSGHNFCKACLDKKFAGIADEVAGGGHAAGIRSIRVRKQLKPCPTCKVRRRLW